MIIEESVFVWLCGGCVTHSPHSLPTLCKCGVQEKQARSFTDVIIDQTCMEMTTRTETWSRCGGGEYVGNWLIVEQKHENRKAKSGWRDLIHWDLFDPAATLSILGR